LRLVMILLSRPGLPATAIAGLLGCDPATVGRWIHRDNTQSASGLGDRPRAGRGPGWAAPGLASASCGCSLSPRLDDRAAVAAAGRPAISQRTLRRRVREVAC
jgi:hypothetical protein